MSTTTQILFNSPALHSLRRDQLVKLCKIHALKASGKNKDLVQRLRRHAKALPPDDPLSIATWNDGLDTNSVADSEDEASSHTATPLKTSRPGEQREVGMDTIAEVDEETLRSNRGTSDRQAGEFGTNTSKVSVTSSLRAIVNSLGLKRNISKSDGSTSSSSSLSGKDVGQSSSTLPTSDPNVGPEESPVEPVPGQSNLQGFPAPSDARLSLTQAATSTTIRLVSNPAVNPELLLSPPKLKPFATSFDLVPGTPAGAGDCPVPVWPLSPGDTARESLYPAIPIFEGFGDLVKQFSPFPGQYDNSDMDIDVDMPGSLVPSVQEPTPAKTRPSARFNTGATPKSNEKPSAEPLDIFSPAPKPQKASIRSRLAIPRSEPFVFGSPLPQNNMSNLQFRTAAQSVLDEMNKRLAKDGVEAVDTNVLNHRRTTEESTEKQASDVPVRVGDVFDKIHQKEFDKMDSITSHYAAKRGMQSTSSQPILSKKRKASLVIKDRQPGVPAAQYRPNGSRVASGVSVKTLLGAFEGEEDVAVGRMSKRPRVEQEESDVLAEKATLSPSPDPEEEARKQKEREAIRRRLEHNKAKRRSSMGRPSFGRAPPPKPTRFGFLASAKSIVQNVWNRGAGSKAPSSIPVTKTVQFKETKSLSRAASRIPSGGSSGSVQFNTVGRSTLAPPVVSGEGTGTTPRTWKSSIPSPNPPSSSAAVNPRSSSTIAGVGQANHRSLVGFAPSGTKASSLGHKSNIRSSATNLQKQTGTIPRSRTMSTLMAPTASSLAKTTARAPGNENGPLGKGVKPRIAVSPLALEQITNSPGSPTQAKVFSHPLSLTTVSLGAAATHLVGDKATTPKAKVLAGRRPRISRSKVIARLASQRAAGTSARAGGKVRSSTGAEVMGKASSYGGARGNEVLMSAKKRVRQSEQARKSRAIIESESRMDVD